MPEFGKSEELFYRTHHPEMQQGEMWLTNVATENTENEIGYKSKRVGRVAYDSEGKAIPGLVPMFVSKEEYDKKMTPLEV